MKDIIKEIKKEYLLIEDLLENTHKSIFIIENDKEIIEHRIMELSIALENLGISINELDEMVL